ncbi:putative D-alanine-D-alanine ligase [Fadolivirus algeromassiliense]|jgi:D-alanine-D-alanine ligase|uniref:D-alanine-D-alanine ligase n=1 Tax=Fadolivirus FV1/VV64 TaxID=3070911 RepID=A0A7D3V979_9VIRU|nr:putative D-alanine-D-alanine ligase [Fadolivirus algeromassiliense]QKF94757.1 putative D-alanine-D-alanine ligase [Fadolivirus FV1/VV64]
MKICVLNSSYEKSNSPFATLDPYSNPEFYYEGIKHSHTFHQAYINKATASQQIRDLVKEGFDVFINLCDGAFDEDRAGKEVVELLEFYGQAYTGADLKFYEPSRATQKMIAYYHGVRTPVFGFAYNDLDIMEISNSLKYPVIVKHYNGYSSIGMTKKSRCETVDEMIFETRRMIQQYGGALIEEFIEGREFTALVCENSDDPSNPIAFDPIECIFSNGETFKHFDLKWVNYDSIQWVRCNDVELNNKIKEMAKKMFVGLDGVGYGRLDIRVDQNNEPYYLEINPNCGIFYPKSCEGSADFILLNDSVMGHVGFIEHIMKCAITRKNNRVKKTEIRFKPNKGYGMYALRDILEGEVVHQYEEKPTYIVSKNHVERNWNDPLKKQWFKQYAYPITETTYCIWSPNPEEWLQLNHSCDPNVWLDGLNIVARRSIKKNEQISIEYATFCTDMMEEFVCHCGSKQCRGVIKGSDYMLPSIRETYNEHVTDYVKSKW